jgi:hypothetical protein
VNSDVGRHKTHAPFRASKDEERTVTLRVWSGIKYAFITILLLLSACSTARVDERLAYWHTETLERLPPGTTLQDAQAFFASRGLKLGCCVSSPPQIVNAYWASEPRVGRSFFMEYGIMILVHLSPDQKVEKVLVQRIGVGF